MYKSHQHIYQYLWISILCTVFVFIIIRRTMLFSPGVGESIASYLLYPALRFNSTIKQWWNSKTTFNNSTNSEQHELQEAYLDLIAENIQLRASHAYYKDIQEIQEFQKRYHMDYAYLARILVTACTDYEHTILVDAGSRQGIQPDMVAIYKNIVVGKVSHVYPQYSRVILITDRHCKIACCCAQTGAKGVLSGMNNKDRITLDYVCHLSTLKKRDLVLSSGKGHIFPAGFALGTIQSYQNNGLLYEATVKPMLDIEQIEYCYIVSV